MGLRYISRRMRFESEVRSHLRGKGIHGEELERTMVRLEELQVLSDFETCRAWIRDRIRFSPRARRALRVELMRKGVSEDTITDALDEICPPDGQVELAVAALKSPAAALKSHPEAVVSRRMWADLGRKGFDRETTREAIDRVLGGSEEE